MFKFKMLVLFLLVALLVSCTPPGIPISGSGKVVTQEEDISAFDKLDVSHAFKVDISQGETFSVVVRIDENLVQYLEVVKQGSTLKMGLNLKSGQSVRNATLQAEVTMPELAGLDLSGATNVTISGLTSAKRALVVDASGDSQLRGDIEAGDASFNLSGNSEVTVSGSAQDLTINAAGNSVADLSAFSVADANVVAGGNSVLTVNASGGLDVDAGNAATVYYLGSPTLGTIKESGKGEVRPR